ncbi:hypothetical protein [Streptomyces sp. NPDC127197]|uniref:hypothetical protein n=1 Tax=Streptomyces sp. NPDC127197 TaxID=3345388 RepID=UPI003627178D
MTPSRRLPSVASYGAGAVRRLGGLGASSPQQLTARAETLAAIVVNGLLATGPGGSR